MFDCWVGLYWGISFLLIPFTVVSLHHGQYLTKQLYIVGNL